MSPKYTISYYLMICLKIPNRWNIFRINYNAEIEQIQGLLKYEEWKTTFSQNPMKQFLSIESLMPMTIKHHFDFCLGLYVFYNFCTVV